MIRTLLAPVFGSHLDSVTLDLAAELGRHFRAHIDVVHVTSTGEATPDPGKPAGVQAHAPLSRETDPRQLFETWRSTNGFREQLLSHHALVSASFHALQGWAAVQLPNRARFADLVCMATAAGEGPDMQGELAEAILFTSGRPVLMLPARERYAPGTLLGSTAVVGWNGSPEAVRAVVAALPFVQVSEHVEVITIDEDATRAADAFELASYLAFHGIAATAAGFSRKDWSGGDVIDVAVDRRAGLLVIGARRHTGPRALGSATRHVLSDRPLPVLMAA